MTRSPGACIVSGPSRDEGQVQHPSEQGEASLLVVAMDDGQHPVSSGQRPLRKYTHVFDVIDSDEECACV